MKKSFLFLCLLFVSFAAIAQDTNQTVEPFAWKDFAVEALGIVLAIVALIGRFFIKGPKADILEWVKKAIVFLLDLLPAKEKDGTFNGVGESYK